MRVQAFENLGDGKFRNHREADPLRLSWMGYIHDDGETEHILEEVYVFLNRDDRPNRKIRPSLSMGDVITLDGGPRRLRESYAVERSGFRKLKKPILAGAEECISLPREIRASGVKNIIHIPRRVES